MNLTRLSASLTASAALALAGFATFAPSAQAQPPVAGGGHMAPGGAGAPGRMDPAERAKRKAMHDKMIAELHLTPDQQTKLKKAEDDTRTKMKAVFMDKTLPQDKKKSQMMALMMDQRKKNEAILTPAQKAKYDAMRAQQKAASTPKANTPATH